MQIDIKKSKLTKLNGFLTVKMVKVYKKVNMPELNKTGKALVWGEVVIPDSENILEVGDVVEFNTYVKDKSSLSDGEYYSINIETIHSVLKKKDVVYENNK